MFGVALPLSNRVSRESAAGDGGKSAIPCRIFVEVHGISIVHVLSKESPYLLLSTICVEPLFILLRRK